jgi:plastocyanin
MGRTSGVTGEKGGGEGTRGRLPGTPAVPRPGRPHNRRRSHRMNHSFLVACAAAVALAGLGAARTADAQATAAPSSTTVVHIRNFAFVPASVTVKVGDTVQFVNEDSTPHTATSSDKSFDSGNLDQNAKWSYTFKKAGTYAYICTYHPYMKGTVVVGDTP